MKVTIEVSDFLLQDVKRLVAESTRGEDGQIPVVRDDNWPQWIGAARSHLRWIMEQIEKKAPSEAEAIEQESP